MWDSNKSVFQRNVSNKGRKIFGKQDKTPALFPLQDVLVILVRQIVETTPSACYLSSPARFLHIYFGMKIITLVSVQKKMQKSKKSKLFSSLKLAALKFNKHNLWKYIFLETPKKSVPHLWHVFHYIACNFKI